MTLTSAGLSATLALIFILVLFCNPGRITPCVFPRIWRGVLDWEDSDIKNEKQKENEIKQKRE